MACNYSAGNISYLTEALNGTGPFEAVQCQFTQSLGAFGADGGIALGLFVFGTVGMMYFLSDRSFVVPLVLAVMIGGVVMSELPAGMVQLAALVFVMVGTTGGLYIIHRVRQRN